MRILINGISAVAGGGITVLRQLVTWLPEVVQAKHELIFAVPETIFLPAVPAPHRMFRIPTFSRGVIERFWWENSQLLQLVHEQSCDSLFCLANIIPFRQTGVPTSVLIQNVAPLMRPVLRAYQEKEGWKPTLYQYFLRLCTLNALRVADRVIVPSHFAATLVNRAGSRTNPEVVHYGCDHQVAQSADSPTPAPFKHYFLFVSNIYVYKGLEYLIEAMRLNPDFPPVVVIGKPFDQGYFQMIRQQISQNQLDHRFHFPGEVPYEDLGSWYSGAIALVNPSWCESFSAVLLEAMDCHCPVVAVKEGTGPEICGQAGFYARRRDGQSLGQAMRQAWEMPLSGRAVARTRAREFSWQDAAGKYIRILEATNGESPDRQSNEIPEQPQ